MLKRNFFWTFASFLLLLIAIIVPFGIVISYYIGKKIGIISDYKDLYGIYRYFSSYFSNNGSNNAHLSVNVDVLDSVKSTKKETFTK